MTTETIRRASLADSMLSFENVLRKRPGFRVDQDVFDQCIVVDILRNATQYDTLRVIDLAREGWGGWPVKVRDRP